MLIQTPDKILLNIRTPFHSQLEIKINKQNVYLQFKKVVVNNVSDGIRKISDVL